MHTQHGSQHEALPEALTTPYTLNQLRSIVPVKEVPFIDTYQIELLEDPLQLVHTPLPPRFSVKYPKIVPILLNNAAIYDQQINDAVRADPVIRALRIIHDKNVTEARRCRRSIVALLFDEAETLVP